MLSPELQNVGSTLLLPKDVMRLLREGMIFQHTMKKRVGVGLAGQKLALKD